MLNHKQIAVIGGDERYVYMIKRLAHKSAYIFAVGFTEVSFNNPSIQKCTINDLTFKKLDAVILPVHGMDETHSVDQYFPMGQIQIPKTMFTHLSKQAVIFSGTANDFLRSICVKNQRELIVLFELESVAILNALPTAEATLQLAMEETKRTIHEQTVLVTGFGRVAQAIANLFQAVGAKVYIAARQQADLATANIRGYHTTTFDRLKYVVQNVNICINTVPHLIFTNKLIKQMSRKTVIIDIASQPGGTDFQEAYNFGIKAIHALGLPGKTAPVTAGEIIAKPIIERLIEG